MDMDIEEARERVIEDYDPNICPACGSAEMFACYEIAAPFVVMTDFFGIHWCLEHQFRGEFVNLMAKWGWPAIDVYNEEMGREKPDFSLGLGISATLRAALSYSEEVVVFLTLKAMEDHQESEQVA